MQALSRAARQQGKRIALVPTMGALHEGHLSLVRIARPLADRLVVSLFVNPTQFGPGEDLDRYPVDIETDRALCEAEGVDTLFCPEADSVYAPDHSTYVRESSLSTGLCGAARPGHFRGVTTVVAKLFNIVQPDVAVFGQKDGQQVAVIERMTRDLDFPVRIVTGPIVREADGLAMSSRNAYLSPEERSQAVCLVQALRLAERLYGSGERSAARLRESMRDMIDRYSLARSEYIELVDRTTLQPVERVAGPVLVALCVHLGSTRLIDNTLLGEADRSG